MKDSGEREALGIGLVFLLIGLVWYLPASPFPYVYHTDEPSKVDQLVERKRNMRHPVLMLTVAEVVTTAAGVGTDRQRVAEWGRRLSGLYVALAVGTLVAVVALAGGWLAGVAAGVLMLAQASFYEASHFFKEDALHLGTLGLLGLMVALGERRWQRSGGVEVGSLIAVGVALGLAVSARYYAVFLIPMVAVWGGLRAGWSWTTGVALVGPVLMLWAMLHLPWILGGTPWVAEVRQEWDQMVGGHYGVGLAVPHFLYWRLWGADVSGLESYAVVTGLIWVMARGRLTGWLVLIGVMIYVLAITWSPKFADRYLLPVEWVLVGVAGMGFRVWMEGIYRMSMGWGRKTAGCVTAFTGAVLMGWMVMIPGERLQERVALFQRDSRQELAAWIEANLPPEGKVAEDDQGSIREWLPNRVVAHQEFVVDLGTVEDWREQGIEYVVLCRDRHHRYTAKGQRRAVGDVVGEIRAERYRRLLEEGEILWSGEPRDPKALHPGLDLVRTTGIFEGGEGRGLKSRSDKVIQEE